MNVRYALDMYRHRIAARVLHSSDHEPTENDALDAALTKALDDSKHQGLFADNARAKEIDDEILALFRKAQIAIEGVCSDPTYAAEGYKLDEIRELVPVV